MLYNTCSSDSRHCFCIAAIITQPEVRTAEWGRIRRMSGNCCPPSIGSLLCQLGQPWMLCQSPLPHWCITQLLQYSVIIKFEILFFARCFIRVQSLKHEHYIHKYLPHVFRVCQLAGSWFWSLWLTTTVCVGPALWASLSFLRLLVVRLRDWCTLPSTRCSSGTYSHEELC